MTMTMIEASFLMVGIAVLQNQLGCFVVCHYFGTTLPRIVQPFPNSYFLTVSVAAPTMRLREWYWQWMVVALDLVWGTHKGGSSRSYGDLTVVVLVET